MFVCGCVWRSISWHRFLATGIAVGWVVSSSTWPVWQSNAGCFSCGVAQSLSAVHRAGVMVVTTGATLCSCGTARKPVHFEEVH